MKTAKPSLSAQHVALARALLHRRKAIDDPYAESMLRTGWAIAYRAARLWPLTLLESRRASVHVAARTLFFDTTVNAALDSGVRQVVVLGAGYDARAWRLARPGVRFFEVDHPATQAEKRLRAPAGGPSYVAADLPADRLEEVLPAAGYRSGEPTVFLLEGLTQYLSEGAVHDLGRTLSALGGAGSRMMATFGFGPAADSSRFTRASIAAFRAVLAVGHERLRFSPTPRDVPDLLGATGWRTVTLLTDPEVGERYLADTGLPRRELNPLSCMVDAVRA